MFNKAKNLKELEAVVDYENKQKNPTEYCPKFKPDLTSSQNNVKKEYKEGFHQFLQELN